MDQIFLLESYQKMASLEQIVFLDLLRYFSESIRTKTLKVNDFKNRRVEGLNMVLLVYKSPYTFGKEILENFNISDASSLWNIAFMRLRCIELLQKALLIQKFTLAWEVGDLLKKSFTRDSVFDKEMLVLDRLTGKRKFIDNVLSKQDGKVFLKEESIEESSLSEEEKKVIDIGINLIKAHWYDELNRQANLDESYYQYDTFITDRGNIEKVRNTLFSDEWKDIIKSIEFKNDELLINDKIFILTPKRRWDWKTCEFISLLTYYFSRCHAKQVDLKTLLEYFEKFEFKKEFLKAIDITKQDNISNWYLKTFHRAIDDIFWWKPRIFEIKKSIIYLNDMKKWVNSSQDLNS